MKERKIQRVCSLLRLCYGASVPNPAVNTAPRLPLAGPARDPLPAVPGCSGDSGCGLADQAATVTLQRVVDETIALTPIDAFIIPASRAAVRSTRSRSTECRVQVLVLLA